MRKIKSIDVVSCVQDSMRSYVGFDVAVTVVSPSQKKNMGVLEYLYNHA